MIRRARKSSVAMVRRGLPSNSFVIFEDETPLRMRSRPSSPSRRASGRDSFAGAPNARGESSPERQEHYARNATKERQRGLLSMVSSKLLARSSGGAESTLTTPRWDDKTGLEDGRPDEILVEIHSVHRHRVPCTPAVAESIAKLSELQAHSLVDLLEGGRSHHGEWDDVDLLPDLEHEAPAGAGVVSGVVSRCTVTHARDRISFEMRPMLQQAPPELRQDGAPWPPPPAALVSSADVLNQWLQLAVQVKKKKVEEETIHDHQHFLFAKTALASHMSFGQQLRCVRGLYSHLRGRYSHMRGLISLIGSQVPSDH
jgi:hypothetical protein